MMRVESSLQPDVFISNISVISTGVLLPRDLQEQRGEHLTSADDDDDDDDSCVKSFLKCPPEASFVNRRLFQYVSPSSFSALRSGLTTKCQVTARCSVSPIPAAVGGEYVTSQ